MNKVYARIFWENSPSTKSPLGAMNLNRTDYAINAIDDRVIVLDTEKANKIELLNLVNGWTMDEHTGIITVTKVNGEKIMFDLNIEKIPVDFSLSPEGILTMTTSDGTKFTANIGAMIPVLEFESTDTISVTVTGEGVNKKYSFAVKNGSITEDKLQTNFLADVKTQTAAASAAATASADSAKAAKESEDSAKESEDAAEKAADEAQASKISAKESEDAAKRSEDAAKDSETNAKQSETNAAESEKNAKQSEENASESETNAAESEQAASNSAVDASNSADLSKSYAVGGTGIRDGEDADNSKYYSEISQNYRDESEQFSKSAEDAVSQINKKLKLAEFDMDDDGNLIYTDDSAYEFSVDDNGMLNWEVA